MAGLLFASKASADTAIATINAAMGLSADEGDVTTTWAVAIETADHKWFVPMPEDRFMVGVTDHTTGQPVWPADPGMGGS